jgi:hypothetical protein
MQQLTDVDIAAPQTKQDLELLGESLSDMDTIKNLGTMYQAKILYHVHKNWQFIDTQITGFWQYDFYNWAKSFTQNDQSLPHKSTIDNKIAVYRDWIAEELIEAPKDISNVPYTKLLYARTIAKSGHMTAELWQMLYDDTPAKTFQAKIKNFKQPDDVSLFTRDGIIYVSDGCQTIPIGYLDYDESDKPLWRIGIEKLAKFCKLDEFVL